MNVMKTALLLAGMTALFGTIGLLLGGSTGMIIALLIAAAMNLYSYWNSDRLALRAYDAREVDERSAPEFVTMVRQLSANAGLPMPRVYIFENPQPNAFATGRNPQNAAVAASTGLINMLTPDELAGVMAHELAHIKNRDTLIMTITATFAGAISSLMNFGFLFRSNRNNGGGAIVHILMMILAPLAAMLIQMAISRTREYAADRMGAEICGKPLALAAALEKIAGGVAHIPNEAAELHPATAHMFIMNPLSGRGMDNLFSTHPAAANRIAALVEQAREMGVAPQNLAANAGPWQKNAPQQRKGPWG